MSDPRFRPRSYAQVPSQFGKDEPIAWRAVEGRDEVSRLATARLQNAIAAQIGVQLRSRGLTVKDYAAMAGVGYDRMLKVLRGDVLMRLEDISDAQRLLGGITCVTSGRRYPGPSSSSDRARRLGA